MGFCKQGEAGPFVENGRIELGGELPINTWGGQLSGGRLHGFGHLAESVRQVRRECGRVRCRTAKSRWSPPAAATSAAACC